VAAGDLYELTVHMAVQETACQFGQAYRMTTGTYNVTTAQAAAQAWFDANMVNLLLSLSEAVEIDAIRFNPIGISTELDGGIAMDGANGDEIGNPIPANCCALIHLPTVAPNSKHNGRIFLPGIVEAGINDGVLTAAQLALTKTFADKLDENLVTLSPDDAIFVPGVISRFEDGIKRVPPVIFDIKNPVVKTATRQQRSRMTRRVGLG